MKIKKIKYISGLKGLACLFVFVGHFLGIYKYAENFNSSIRFLDLIINSPFNFFVNETVWLYLFFVVSGFLVAKSNIQSIKELIAKVIKRFFRFFIPIIFSSFVIYVIYVLIGFYNENTSDIFICSWFQSFYDYDISIVDILKSPFDILFNGNAIVNPVYWVLKSIFVASIIIYFFKYLIYRTNNKKCIIFLLLLVLIFSYFFYSKKVTACLIGLFFVMYDKNKNNYNKIDKLIFSFFIIIIVIVSDIYIFASILFGILILYIPHSNTLSNVFTSKYLNYLGEISWGIYSFHFPIISSIGSLILLKTYTYIGINNSYYLSFIVSLTILIIVSDIYNNTFEKISNKIMIMINNIISKLFI